MPPLHFDPAFEPLGFSDLNQDEELLIITYRDWKRRTAIKAVAEHAIASLLRTAPIYPFLPVVFRSFRRYFPREDRPGHDGLLLTRQEEALLTGLAPYLSDFCIRPAYNILRSGRDRSLLEVDQTYWGTTAAMTPRKPLN